MRRTTPIIAVMAICILCCCGTPTGTVATVVPHTRHLTATIPENTVTIPGNWDWPSYGQNAQHTFVGSTTLTASTASTLKVAWRFPTGDAVTATPTVVGGVVYVGSWDTKFYALDLATGHVKWQFQLDQQHGVTPYPGEPKRDNQSDGGLVTSSAWFQPGNGTTRPDLVIFGGGYTLYALDAHTGALFWKHAYPGSTPAEPKIDDTRIFSSPVVVNGVVLFGTSADGQSGEHGELVGANLETGAPAWVDVTDAGANGRPLDDGCGNVWSSGSVIPSSGLVVFDSADCSGSNSAPWSEQVFAVYANTGSIAWRFKPVRRDAKCDLDFGASVNVGLTQNGSAAFIGVGSKDGVYYSLDPATGSLRWSRRVVYGGSAGGFIGTAAYNGSVIVGATGLGDVAAGTPGACDDGNPADQFIQNPALHSFDAATGRLLWQMSGVQSVASTTIVGDLLFEGPALRTEMDVRLVKTGALVARLQIPNPSWSGIAAVGDAIVFGIGDDPEGSPAGLMCFTPGGKPPVVP